VPACRFRSRGFCAPSVLHKHWGAQKPVTLPAVFAQMREGSGSVPLTGVEYALGRARWGRRTDSGRAGRFIHFPHSARIDEAIASTRSDSSEEDAAPPYVGVCCSSLSVYSRPVVRCIFRSLLTRPSSSARARHGRVSPGITPLAYRIESPASDELPTG